MSPESEQQSEDTVAPTKDSLPTKDDDSEAHDNTEIPPLTTTDGQPPSEPYTFPSFPDSAYDDFNLNRVTENDDSVAHDDTEMSPQTTNDASHPTPSCRTVPITTPTQTT